MTTLELRLTVDADGGDAEEMLIHLADQVDAGELDQAMLNLLRNQAQRSDGDWRIVRVTVTRRDGESC